MEAVANEIAFMGAAAWKAFLILMDLKRLGYLAAGCVMGLVLGIVPGIGGLAGTAMLLPFTFNMDPYSAFALLLGLGSTTATGDPIPAVLFGVPGGAASAATVLDGFPMAKKGEAGRALSACYMSSMMGGIFGAFLLAVSIPILRPVMLFLGSPELLAFAVLGISMVALLSGNAPLRGLAAGCLGIMIAMIGTDPQSGTLRWTFNSLYLWDGLPLTPLLLGVFALPELCDLLITRAAIAQGFEKTDIYKGQWQGVKDCFTHWWLIVRCSWIGGGIGSIPGISASVVDWLAYGHALKTEKGASLTFGKGDVRGVIASESSNNAKEGGALVPTVAFGVPGSATMAILLGAFLIHGLVPGPDMLHKNLDITYSMVWSVALANILGAGMCYAFSPQFAKLATLRFSLILPAVMGIIYIGAFEATRQWGDLYALLFFGVVGWCMKQFKWPRPPLILGAVLGDTIERYMFISVERYSLTWLDRPVVAILLFIAILGLLRPLLQDIRIHGQEGFRPPAAREAQSAGMSMWIVGVLRIALVATIPLVIADYIVRLFNYAGGAFASTLVMKIVVGVVVAGPVLIWWLRHRNIARDTATALAVIVALVAAELISEYSALTTPPPTFATMMAVGIAIGFLKSLIVALILVLWLQFNNATREHLIVQTNAYMDRSAAERTIFTNGLKRMVTEFQAPRFHPSQLFTIFMLAILTSMVVMALRWDFSAKIVPLVVGGVGMTVCLLSLLNDMCRIPTAQASESLAESAQHQVEQKIHMDLASDTEHLPIETIIRRGYRFFAYLVAFMMIMYVIGLVPTVGLFVIFFMRYENQEPWKLVIIYALVLVISISFVFDNIMSIPWPPTLIAQWFPVLKFLPSI
jgi:TctA family transporter